jgi:hypothetical protein
VCVFVCVLGPWTLIAVILGTLLAENLPNTGSADKILCAALSSGRNTFRRTLSPFTSLLRLLGLLGLLGLLVLRVIRVISVITGVTRHACESCTLNTRVREGPEGDHMGSCVKLCVLYACVYVAAYVLLGRLLVVSTTKEPAPRQKIAATPLLWAVSTLYVCICVCAFVYVCMRAVRCVQLKNNGKHTLKAV